MIKYVIEFRDGQHFVYRKRWWGGRKYIGVIDRDDSTGDIRRRMIVRDVLMNDVQYDFINFHPGYESSKKNQKFIQSPLK